jgi:hypothetical protein
MPASPITPPRPETPVPPRSSDVVVPIRPKPSAFARPIIIEEDVVEYLVRASVEQRWRILSRAAMATHEEPAPASAPPPSTERSTTMPPAPFPSSIPPPPKQPVEVVPAPESKPPKLELVDAPSVAPPRLAYSAPPPPRTQKSATDPAEKLFEAMHELTLLESGPEGASFCLRTALAVVPCLAGLVHLRDPKTLELDVVHAQGPHADGLLHTHTPQTDPLVARAARAGKPTVATYGAEPDAEKTSCPRHAFFDPWSVVIVPVTHGGQLLGLLEMIDPIDGNPSDEQAQAALAYIAERLGGFLAERAEGVD